MSIIRADSIKNRAGNGAPDFPNGITVTGVITATSISQTLNGDLSVTGNLGIGGTLTYEDVTNIDSVGLITARSGIKIGPTAGVAGTFFADGSYITAGIVTVFGTGIDYTWQGGTSMAWWKSEDMVSTSSWPAAKGGSDANLVSHNGGTSGMTYHSSDSSFNGHKSLQQGSNAAGGLRTTNQDSGYWWNGSDAFTVIMALKKDSNSLGNDQQKSKNEDSSLLELENLENKKEIESQLLEV